jgi:serine/threonine protein kinase
MTNISGYVIEEEDDIKIDAKYTISPFSLCSRVERKTLYSLKPEERRLWVDLIRHVLCYSDIYNEYEIGEFLGSGKYGEVRKCTHKETGRKVAIKILSKHKMKIKNYDMVRNEIEVLKLCQHPNILRLYDVLENVDYIFLVMELLGGGTLRDYMKAHNNKIPESKAKTFIRAIVSGLDYMNQFGILHRDIKPINLLFTNDGVLKIADFGLAIILGPSQQCMSCAGTLDFCAPEVIVGLPYGPKVDIWSMGIVAWYLLNGCLPFDSPNDSNIKK